MALAQGARLLYMHGESEHRQQQYEAAVQFQRQQREQPSLESIFLGSCSQHERTEACQCAFRRLKNQLSPTEFALVVYNAAQPSQALPQEAALALAWCRQVTRQP